MTFDEHLNWCNNAPENTVYIHKQIDEGEIHLKAYKKRRFGSMYLWACDEFEQPIFIPLPPMNKDE